MRKENNLDRFGHDTKSDRERAAYVQNTLDIEQQKGGTTKEESKIGADFEETAGIEGKVVEGEDISPKPERPPYRSTKTKLLEDWQSKLLISLLLGALGLLSWGLLTIVNNSKDITRQESGLEYLEKDLTDLRSDFSVVRDRSIQSETLLKTIINRVIDIGNQR